MHSGSRLNDDLIKKNLEQEIANRTEALRNCQKKMGEMSLDNHLLRNE